MVEDIFCSSLYYASICCCCFFSFTTVRQRLYFCKAISPTTTLSCLWDKPRQGLGFIAYKKTLFYKAKVLYFHCIHSKNIKIYFKGCDHLKISGLISNVLFLLILPSFLHVTGNNLEGISAWLLMSVYSLSRNVNRTECINPLSMNFHEFSVSFFFSRLKKMPLCSVKFKSSSQSITGQGVAPLKALDDFIRQMKQTW